MALTAPEEPSEDRSPRHVDRRADARIVRTALDEVKAIQTLLSDAYKDVGGAVHNRGRLSSG